MSWSEKNIELIGKYLNGEASEAEIEEAELLIDNEPEEFEAYQKVWQFTKSPSFNTDAAWSKMQKRINVDSVKEDQTNVIKLKPYTRLLGAIAAVLVLGVFLFKYFQVEKTPDPQLATTLEDSTTVRLLDGSKVDLASHSTLSFIEEEGIRKVELEGRAFFDVHRDTTKPFIISTKKARVQVLGTSFEVKAFPDDSIVLVQVSSGKVMVYAVSEQLITPKKKIILTKGQSGYLNCNTNDLHVVQKLKKPKRLKFEDQTIFEICEQLEMHYGIKFLIGTNTLSNCRITITLKDRGLNSTLKAIKNQFQVDHSDSVIDFEIEEDRVTVKSQGC